MTSLTQLAQELIEKSKKATAHQVFHGSASEITTLGIFLPGVTPDAIQSLCQAFLEAVSVIETMTKDCVLYCLEGDHSAEWEMETKPCPHCKSGREFLAKYGEKK